LSKMDHQKLYTLFIELGLGNLTAELTPVTGGLTHKMWHAVTDQGVFAVKQLNPTIMARPRASSDILGGEEIAGSFAKDGISVSAALSFDGQTILKAGEAEIMLFEWVDGITLEEDDVTIDRCRQIGELFGQMHNCRLSIENLALPANQAFDKNHWAELLNRARSAECAWVGETDAALPYLIRFSAAYADALPLLQANTVASHRDLDIKNTMWKASGHPVIIDWEAGGLVNPMWELLDAALNWCGQTSGQPDKERFQALIAGYQTVQPLNAAMIEPAFAGCLGARMEWLEFNMQRSIDTNTPSEEQSLGTGQVTSTLADILSLEAGKRDFFDWLPQSE
jgi:Ser/Thr protein kinase RdoA (MazF antagonist)